MTWSDIFDDTRCPSCDGYGCEACERTGRMPQLRPKDFWAQRDNVGEIDDLLAQYRAENLFDERARQ